MRTWDKTEEVQNKVEEKEKMRTWERNWNLEENIEIGPWKRKLMWGLRDGRG